MAAINPWEFSYTEMRREAERELMRRKRVYPRQLGKHGFTQVRAEREMALQRSIVMVLRELEKTELLL